MPRKKSLKPPNDISTLKANIKDLNKMTRDHHDLCACSKCIALSSYDRELELLMNPEDTILTEKDSLSEVTEVPESIQSLTDTSIQSLTDTSTLTLGHWWLHTPSTTYYQLRRLPLTMDKINDREAGIVLWHRDHKYAIHLPVEIPSDFQYHGPGHNAPTTSQSSRIT